MSDRLITVCTSDHAPSAESQKCRLSWPFVPVWSNTKVNISLLMNSLKTNQWKTLRENTHSLSLSAFFFLFYLMPIFRSGRLFAHSISCYAAEIELVTKKIEPSCRWASRQSMLAFLCSATWRAEIRNTFCTLHC